MSRVIVVAAVLVVVGGALAGGGGDPAFGKALACPANPSPPNPADPSMVLNQPAPNATVTSPVQLSGLARVFEANVRITVYSASGMVLADTFTTAAEAGPALAPFSADVPFTVLTSQAGCIRVFEESAADGSPRNIVQVEVNLSPGGSVTPTVTPTPAPVRPPSTGDAGLSRQSQRWGVSGLGVAVVAGLLLALGWRRGARG